MTRRRDPLASAEEGSVSYDTLPTPTATEYTNLQRAYQHFNAALFNSELPDVLITLQRHANARGFFRARAFSTRERTLAAVLAGLHSHTHELALNPDTFEGRTDREIISTLVHEMVHVWEEVHGTAPKRFYHNKIWAQKMKAIGLQPSSTGQPGGKETGQSCSHYIIQDSPFTHAWEQLADTGFKLHWQRPVRWVTCRRSPSHKAPVTLPASK